MKTDIIVITDKIVEHLQCLKEERNETVTNCHALKLQAADGKMRLADVADTELLFRLIQPVLKKGIVKS